MAQTAPVEAPGRITLSDLPPELVGHIVSLACTDGGQAGCILSAVSRYVADAKKQYRYQSVALSGQEKIMKFHYAVACPAGREAARAEPVCVRPTLRLSVHDKLLPPLAPHLATLTCIIFGAAKNDLLPPLPTRSFPTLTGLTLRLTLPELSLLAPDAGRPRMPRLHRLTYAVADPLVLRPALLTALVPACLALAHLDLADVVLSFLNLDTTRAACSFPAGVRVRMEATLNPLFPPDASEEYRHEIWRGSGTLRTARTRGLSKSGRTRGSRARTGYSEWGIVCCRSHTTVDALAPL